MIVRQSKNQLSKTVELEERSDLPHVSPVQKPTGDDWRTGGERTLRGVVLHVRQFVVANTTTPRRGGGKTGELEKSPRPVSEWRFVGGVACCPLTGATEARSRSMAVSCRSSKDGREAGRTARSTSWGRDRFHCFCSDGPGRPRLAASQTPQKLGLTGLTQLTRQLTVNGGAHG